MRSDSSLSYRLDPLNLAVEQLWANGITVVVSAGNQGAGSRTIAKPGDDPWVITVGASDDQGTADTADDAVAPFSSRSEEHTSELQSLMRSSYAVFCLTKKNM